MNKFKAGDLVYIIDVFSGVRLISVDVRNNDYVEFAGQPVRKDTGLISEDFKLPSGIHATPENRAHLVGLFGEDAVPKLPLRGSELTKKLLETESALICFVDDSSDDEARDDQTTALINNFDGSYFISKADVFWNYAIPIDRNGNEITELPE